MKIKVPPRQNFAPQKQTIIVKGGKEGCFLQTLNCGCIVLFSLLALIVFGIFWFFGGSKAYRNAKAMARGEKPAAAETTATAKTTPTASEDSGKLNGWQIVRSTDEISDETSYIFALRGLRVTDGNLVEYYPRLIIQAKPKFAPGSANHVEYTARVAVKIEADRFKRDRQEVTLRIDRCEPQTGTLETSDTRECVFLPSNTLAALDGSNTLVLRFTSTLGNTRTLKFNLTGFTVAALEKELAERMAKDRPANR